MPSPLRKRLWRYWRENLETARAAHELTTWCISAIVSVLSSLAIAALALGVPVPSVQKTTIEAVIGCVDLIAAVWFIGFGLFYLPFSRHEKDEKKALDTEALLKSQIAEHEERNRPKLLVECKESVSGCHTMIARATHDFFRLAVTVNWNEPATGCFGILMKIEKDGRVLRDHDVEKLPYARSHEPDALNKTLNPGVREFLDVLVIAVHCAPQKVLAPSTKGLELTLGTRAGLDVFSEHGEYKLTVALCGGNIPIESHELRFNWTGQSTTSSLTLIK